jgi:hypothetical protein
VSYPHHISTNDERTSGNPSRVRCNDKLIADCNQRGPSFSIQGRMGPVLQRGRLARRWKCTASVEVHRVTRKSPSICANSVNTSNIPILLVNWVKVSVPVNVLALNEAKSVNNYQKTRLKQASMKCNDLSFICTSARMR